jgi:hypothetical protein
MGFSGERDITLVFGKTGMGKSRWTKAYLASQRRVICLDPMRDQEGILFDDLQELIAHVEKNQHASYRVRSEFADDFPVLCLLAQAAGQTTFVVEEAQRVVPSKLQGGMSELPPAFEDLVYRGRHRDVSLCFVSQRPSTVNIVARSQWTRIICFQQSEGADVGWLEAATGFDVPAHELEPGEFYDITPRGINRLILSDQNPEQEKEEDDNAPGKPGTDRGSEGNGSDRERDNQNHDPVPPRRGVDAAAPPRQYRADRWNGGGPAERGRAEVHQDHPTRDR